MSHAELLTLHCRARSLPLPEYEATFHPLRKWRFDACWKDLKLAVEVEGGVFIQGRHSRGAGFRNDCEKYAEAAILGWRVIRVLPEHVKSGQAADWIARAMGRAA